MPQGADWPADARCLLATAEVDRVIARLAADISADLGGRNPILMPVLMGGMFTAVRLAAHFEFAYSLDTLRVSRYGADREGGKLRWHSRPGLELVGRHVLLIDDVLDRGVTLAAVAHELRRLTAASVSTAVLVRKRLDPARERPAVDYVGTDAPDWFLFGCGMDLDGSWRGLGSLWGIEPDAEPAVASSL